MSGCYGFDLNYFKVEHIDDPAANVWSFEKQEDAAESKVGVQGQPVLNTHLRQSKSIRDKFRVVKFAFGMQTLLQRVVIGIGSKHIYEKEDFMKEHNDARLPDYSLNDIGKEKREEKKTLPHIMTLILCNDPTRLIVNDKPMTKKAVLFTLNCRHQVVPDDPKSTHRRPLTRISFTFPVYGIRYESVEKPLFSDKNLANEAINKYDYVLKALNHLNEGRKKKKDGDSRAVEYFRGCTKVLNNQEINDLCSMLKNTLEENDDDRDTSNVKPKLRPAVRIKYRLKQQEKEEKEEEKEEKEEKKNGKEYEVTVHEQFVLDKDAYDISITPLSYTECIIDHIEEYVTDLKIASENDAICLADILHHLQEWQVPSEPFMLILMGRYFTDAALDDLAVSDMCAYHELAKRRTVHFKVIELDHRDSERCREYAKLPIFYFTRDGVQAEKDIDPSSFFSSSTSSLSSSSSSSSASSSFSLINEPDIEFDDSQSYDAYFKLAVGAFIVI